MNKFSLSFLLILMVMACNNAGGADQYTIQGTVKNAASKTILLEKLGMTAITVVDTATIDEKGNFKLLGAADKGFYRLKLDDQKFWMFLLDSKSLVASLDGANPAEFSIKGGAENEEFQKAQQIISQQVQLLQQKNYEAQMKQQMGASADEVNRAAAEFQSMLGQFHKTLKENVANTKSSLVALYYVSNLPLDQFPDENKAVLKRMQTEMPNSEYTKAMEQNIAQFEASREAMEAKQRAAQLTSEGAMAQEIALPDPSGNQRKLSSLKGKVVLVDFWASWCGPCRREMPTVVAAYKKYKAKGFDVFSVSLDKNAEAWKRAIETDGMIWEHHVSDLQQWSSPTAAQWGVNAIPATFLLDRDGKIIARNLRGPELEAKLAEVLK